MKRNYGHGNFAEPILIDPSLFDDVHNVLDIVLAKIFRKFYESYNNDNRYVDEGTREKLLDRFQRVYRYVSLINNQKQMLDDEFDYEGNISKLTKLGESTNLKEELAGLIKDYLECSANKSRRWQNGMCQNLFQDRGDSEKKANKTAQGSRRFAASMLDLVYDRTGMRFLPEVDGSSYLLPNNLRDMISWILMIAEMENPKDADGEKKDKIYFENIVKMENYFAGEWTGDHLKLYDGLTLQEIRSMDTFQNGLAVADRNL